MERSLLDLETFCLLSRPIDVHDETDFDVPDPQVCNLITTTRALARSCMSLEDISTNEQFLDVPATPQSELKNGSTSLQTTFLAGHHLCPDPRYLRIKAI